MSKKPKMTFDLETLLQSKRDLRRELAARPIAEKLAMLDALRERTLALRAATPTTPKAAKTAPNANQSQ